SLCEGYLLLYYNSYNSYCSLRSSTIGLILFYSPILLYFSTPILHSRNTMSFHRIRGDQLVQDESLECIEKWKDHFLRNRIFTKPVAAYAMSVKIHEAMLAVSKGNGGVLQGMIERMDREFSEHYKIIEGKPVYGIMGGANGLQTYNSKRKKQKGRGSNNPIEQQHCAHTLDNSVGFLLDQVASGNVVAADALNAGNDPSLSLNLNNDASQVMSGNAIAADALGNGPSLPLNLNNDASQVMPVNAIAADTLDAGNGPSLPLNLKNDASQVIPNNAVAADALDAGSGSSLLLNLNSDAYQAMLNNVVAADAGNNLDPIPASNTHNNAIELNNAIADEAVSAHDEVDLYMQLLLARNTHASSSNGRATELTGINGNRYYAYDDHAGVTWLYSHDRKLLCSYVGEDGNQFICRNNFQYVYTTEGERYIFPVETTLNALS
ncbi:hypothetical protein BC938DRAFT_484163, partial [Jimgerdemannia flammicorona]